MAMSENSKRVLKFLQENKDEKVTAKDVAQALNLGTQSVNGTFTSAIVRKKLGERVPAEIELEDGTHKTVNFFVLNEAGLAYDPDAVEKTESAEK